jgi:hypothetical protein
MNILNKYTSIHLTITIFLFIVTIFSTCSSCQQRNMIRKMNDKECLTEEDFQKMLNKQALKILTLEKEFDPSNVKLDSVKIMEALNVE